MFTYAVPSIVRKVSHSFKDLFEGDLAQYKNHCALFCLFLFGLKSLSDVVRACLFSASVSELSRATQTFQPNRFMRRLRASILRKYKNSNPEDWIYAVDDTANPHFGKTIPHSGVWGGSSGLFNGQKILVIALVNKKSGVVYPVHYAFNRKKECPDYINALELAGLLFDDLLAEGFPKLTVVGDSWFGNKNFMSILDKRGLSFVLEIKSRTCAQEKKHSKWQKIASFFHGKQRQSVQKSKKKKIWCAFSLLKIKKYSSLLLTVGVYNRKNGTTPFAIYVTNKIQMSVEEVWKLSRARWKIECLFRNLKQEFSFGRLPGQGQYSSDLAVCFPFALYTAVLHEQDSEGILGKSTIGYTVKKIRQESMNKSMLYLVYNSSTQCVQNFFNRRSGKSLTSKPVNKAVERI